MRDLVDRVDHYVYETVRFIWRVVEPPLRLLADDRLTLIRRIRIFILLGLASATLCFVVGVIEWRAAYVNSAGLLLDICGALRLFVDEEWDDIIPAYTDPEEYPYGPPSYITRELMADDMPIEEPAMEERGLGPHYFAKRGILMLLLGFILQLQANVM